MQKPRIRVLHNPSVKPEHVSAALDGLKVFRLYGALTDSADISAKDAIKDVKSGKRVKEILEQKSPVQIVEADLEPGIRESFFPKSVYPLVLLDSRMVQAVEREERLRLESRLGLSLRGRGAIISLAKMNVLAALEPALALLAIETAVKHEFGHVLGNPEHCKNTTCVMQEKESFNDFIERFAKKNLDFCHECVGRIGRFISGLELAKLNC